MIKWLEKNKGISLILTILITIEIFHFSSLSGIAGIETGAGSLIPTIYHFVVFFLFSFFLLATIKGNKKLKVSYVITALIISIIQAILDEIHQLFVPFRYSSISDILVNSLGIFSSMIIYLHIYNKIRKKEIKRIDENHHYSFEE